MLSQIPQNAATTCKMRARVPWNIFLMQIYFLFDDLPDIFFGCKPIFFLIPHPDMKMCSDVADMANWLGSRVETQPAQGRSRPTMTATSRQLIHFSTDFDPLEWHCILQDSIVITFCKCQ